MTHKSFKIPVNIYNYHSYVYNMPVEKLILIIFGISLFSIFIRINFIISIIIFMVYFSFLFLIKFDLNKFNEIKRRLDIKKINNKIIKRDNLFFKNGTYFSVIKIGTDNIYTNIEKEYIIKNFNNIFNNIESNFNIITVPYNIDINNKNNYYYSVYLILKSDSNEKILNDTKFIKNYYNIEILENIDLIENIVKLNYHKKHKHYFEYENKYYSFIDLYDARYDNDFLYQLLIESLDFPVILDFKVKNIKKDLKLDRLLAERVSESMRKSNKIKNLNVQINDLKEIIGDSRIYDFSIRLIVISNHPVNLKNSVNSIIKSMNIIGLKFKLLKYFDDNSFDLLDYRGINYLIGLKNLSSIIPFSFTGKPDINNFPAGIEILNNKPFLFNPFKKESYNIIITGETGSGKTYFSEMMINSSSNSSTYIIDPLKEYNHGKIVDVSRGEYLNIDIINSEQKNILAITVKKILRDLSLYDILNKIDSLSGENKNMLYILNKIGDYYNKNKYIDSFKFYIKNYFLKPVEISRDIVFRYDINNNLSEINFSFILSEISYLMSVSSKNKYIVIDEAHLLLKDEKIAESVDIMARHSRHYNTSIVNITQNIDDFYMNSFSRSILKNSMHFFIFRQKEPVRGTVFPNFDINTLNLKGGSGTSYSECYYYSDNYITRLKIFDNKNNTMNTKK